MGQATIGELVYVEWGDSATQDGWKFMDEVELPPSPVKSIGWIVQEEATYLVLAACHSDEEGFRPSCNRRITIPKNMITKRITIMEHLNK